MVTPYIEMFGGHLFTLVLSAKNLPPSQPLIFTWCPCISQLCLGYAAVTKHPWISMLFENKGLCLMFRVGGGLWLCFCIWKSSPTRLLLLSWQRGKSGARRHLELPLWCPSCHFIHWLKWSQSHDPASINTVKTRTPQTPKEEGAVGVDSDYCTIMLPTPQPHLWDLPQLVRLQIDIQFIDITGKLSFL